MPWGLSLVHLALGIYLAVLFGGNEIWELEQTFQLVTMPAAGDKRYYRTGTKTGYQVELVKRHQKLKGAWVVLLPDATVRPLELSHRPSVASVPLAEVDYLPTPVLGPEKRAELLAKASRIAAGTEACAALARYGSPSTRMQLRRLLALGLAAPAVAARWVRWGLRSPWRCAGMAAALFFLYEGLCWAGVFEALERTAQVLRDAWVEFRISVTEASETAREWYESAEWLYGQVAAVMEPWRLAAYVFSAAVLLWAGTATSEAEEASPTSSAAATPTSPEAISPPNELVAQVASSVSAAMNHQKELLEKLIALQVSKGEKDEDEETEQRARQIREDMRREEREAEVERRSRKMLEEMRDRVAAFEEVLRGDRSAGPSGPSLAARAPAPAPSPAPAEPRASGAPSASGAVEPRASGAPAAPGDAPAAVAAVSGGAGVAFSGPGAAAVVDQVAMTVERLKRNALPPQQIFINALHDFKPEDREEWAEHFPVGFRERLAPTWLGEVYGQGRTCKDWAKSWLRERDLGDCSEARELLPTMCAVDTIFMHDRLPGAINAIATEKVARRAYGIVAAFENVKKRNDWQRPPNAKSWSSKVDYELWARIDPGRQAYDKPYVNRRVEEEIRQEMDRDHTMLKARTKLAEQRAKEKD